MGSATKTRVIPGPGFRGRIAQETFTPEQGLKYTTFTGDHFPKNLVGRQVTTSENHPEWRKRRKYANVDIGGEFTTQSQYAVVPQGMQSCQVTVTDGSKVTKQAYVGQVWATDGAAYSFPAYFPSSNSALDAWGTKAIANCKPTNTTADMSTFLAELFREGIPNLIGSTVWQERTEAALKRGGTDPVKGASSDYLSAEFGWKPIASDVHKFLYGVAHASAVLKQYERDAGRVVRRRYSFPPEETVARSLWGVNKRGFMNPSSQPLYDDLPAVGQLFRISTTMRKRWFSGAFTYYIPKGFTTSKELDSFASQARNVLGLKLTPEIIWQLAPWSWAADWVSSIGAAVSNVSDWATDGLVLRYGYIMEHTKSVDTYTFVGRSGLRSHLKPLDVQLVSETKKRRKATPFGFGLTWSGLSSRQLAIASALGITRS